ncbi:MAG TPA: C40 family peptidase, partial [Piscinibacter sp.]|nr:C40 family peptidase [Piscinibacter sp.]
MTRPARLRPALASLALGLALAAGAQAAPEGTAADPIAKLLADRGLGDPDKVPAAVPPSEYAFVQTMRDKASDMVLSAMNFLGVPYRRGGNSAEQGFDCSGFTRHVFEASLGLVLPRRADEQASAAGLIKVKRDELKPGDLVFFNTLKRSFSHVGIYIGEGKFIHSPRTGGEVRVEDMRY